MTEDEIKIEEEEKTEPENLEDADLDTTGVTIRSDIVDPEVSQVAGPYDANRHVYRQHFRERPSSSCL